MADQVALCNEKTSLVGKGIEVAALMLPTFLCGAAPTVCLLIDILERNYLYTCNDKLGEKLTKLPC